MILKMKNAHTNGRCGKRPAYLPPETGIVAYHVSYAIIKSVHPECPRDGDALEEHQEE